MSDAFGRGACMRLKQETAFGTPATGNYINVPFLTHSLGDEQGYEQDHVIKCDPNRRDPRAPGRGLISHGGDVVVPHDLVNIGHWLAGLLGDPVTTGSSDYTHTFKSGGETLPSHTVELYHPESASWLRHTGVKVNTLEIELSKAAGYAQMTFGCIGQTESRQTSSSAGTPTSETYTRFTKWSGSVKKDAAALGNVTGVRMTYSNGMEAIDEIINGEAYVDRIDDGVSSLTGEVSVRFANHDLYDLAISGDPMALELEWSLSSSKSLRLTAPVTRLSKPKVPVEGPGAIRAAFPFRCEFDATEAAMFKAVLKNQKASY